MSKLNNQVKGLTLYPANEVSVKQCLTGLKHMIKHFGTHDTTCKCHGVSGTLGAWMSGDKFTTPFSR